jgi:hypothetical protein
MGQPDGARGAELERLLGRYLHDPNASEPLEPFHAALATLIHGDPATLWDVLEADPDVFPRDREPTSGFVAAHVERLRESGAECVACPMLDWCGGYFKQPDPAYDCGDVRRLLAGLERAAEQLRRDLVEAEEALT